jgi:hypothetical protein
MARKGWRGGKFAKAASCLRKRTGRAHAAISGLRDEIEEVDPEMSERTHPDISLESHSIGPNLVAVVLNYGVPLFGPSRPQC